MKFRYVCHLAEEMQVREYPGIVFSLFLSRRTLILDFNESISTLITTGLLFLNGVSSHVIIEGVRTKPRLRQFFCYLSLSYHRTKKQCAMCLPQHIIIITNFEDIIGHSSSEQNQGYVNHFWPMVPQIRKAEFFFNDSALILFSPLQFLFHVEATDTHISITSSAGCFHLAGMILA